MALLFIALFNSILGLSILFPILAPLGRELGLTELQVGSLSAAYALMQFLTSTRWGRRSERVGRRPVLLTGILGFSVTFALFGAIAHLGLAERLSTPWVYVLLLASRFLGGAFSSATFPSAQAYVADITGRRDRTAGMAVMGAAFGLGVILGPGIGAALGSVSLLLPVYFSAGVGLLNALFVWIRLPEPERRVPLSDRVTPPLRKMAGKVWVLLAVALAANLASVAMEQTVAFYFQDRLDLTAKETARTVGLALVIYGLVAVFMQGFVVRRYRMPAFALLRGGLPFAFLGLLMFVFARDFGWLTAALAIQGLGQGLTLPGVTAGLSLAVGEDEQGAVAGLGSSAQAFGRMLGPIVGTGLYEIRPILPYGFGAAVLLLAMIFLFSSGELRRMAARDHQAAAE
ncbi:MAG: MFS transporter [Myxococcota bacterium]